MNGTDRIIEEIRLDAVKEAERIRAEAEKKAESIIKRAEDNAAEILMNGGKRADEESRAVLRRANASAAAARKRIILKEKQDIIDGVLRAAVDEILNFDPRRYFELMLRLAEKRAGDIPGEIILSERAKTWMTEAFKTGIENLKLTVSEKTADFEGGFIIVYGDIEENCSLRALMESEHDRLHDLLSKFLFDTEAVQ